MKRRWRAAVASSGTGFLRLPIVSDQVAEAIRAEGRHAEGLAAAEERTYWQRRAVADRARAMEDFGRGMAVRVGERDVRRAVLEGELACLEMLERVDRQTAEAALPVLEADGAPYADLLKRLGPKRQAKVDWLERDPPPVGSFSQLHAEVSRPFEPASPELLRAHAEAHRQLLAAKDRELFFGGDPASGSSSLSEWICSNKNPPPSVPLTRETFERYMLQLGRQGRDHAVIKHTGTMG